MNLTRSRRWRRRGAAPPRRRRCGRLRVHAPRECTETVSRRRPCHTGVSRAVLESVIFCHQEDSSWPLQEGPRRRPNRPKFRPETTRRLLSRRRVDSMAWRHASRPAGAVLKKRFDDIFDSARYTKAWRGVVNDLERAAVAAMASARRHVTATPSTRPDESRGSVATASFHEGPRRVE